MGWPRAHRRKSKEETSCGIRKESSWDSSTHVEVEDDGHAHQEKDESVAQSGEGLEKKAEVVPRLQRQVGCGVQGHVDTWGGRAGRGHGERVRGHMWGRAT